MDWIIKCITDALDHMTGDLFAETVHQRRRIKGREKDFRSHKVFPFRFPPDHGDFCRNRL